MSSSSASVFGSFPTGSCSVAGLTLKLKSDDSAEDNRAQRPSPPENRWLNWGSSALLSGMHPRVRRDLTLASQFDHVNGRRVPPFLTRSAFQRRFQFPDCRVARSPDRIERD